MTGLLIAFAGMATGLVIAIGCLIIDFLHDPPPWWLYTFSAGICLLFGCAIATVVLLLMGHRL